MIYSVEKLKRKSKGRPLERLCALRRRNKKATSYEKTGPFITREDVINRRRKIKKKLAAGYYWFQWPQEKKDAYFRSLEFNPFSHEAITFAARMLHRTSVTYQIPLELKEEES